jgi:hypothetical protein
MPRLAYGLITVAIAVAASGCSLHFSDDDPGDDTCLTPLNGEEDSLGAPLPDLLNPETLQCETYGGGGGCRCGENCEPTDQAPAPTWAYCYGSCDSLGEDDCLAATECRATYDYNCYTGRGPCEALVPFIGCHGTDMTGPISGGSCAGLSAQECSRHNDCIALHTPQCSGGGDCWAQFVECRDEGVTCYGEVLCDALPPTCPEGTVPGRRDGCWSYTCVPIDQCMDFPPCDDCG